MKSCQVQWLGFCFCICHLVKKYGMLHKLAGHPLHRDCADLLYMVPISVYVLLKRALVDILIDFLWTWSLGSEVLEWELILSGGKGTFLSPSCTHLPLCLPFECPGSVPGSFLWLLCSLCLEESSGDPRVSGSLLVLNLNSNVIREACPDQPKDQYLGHAQTHPSVLMST